MKPFNTLFHSAIFMILSILMPFAAATQSASSITSSTSLTTSTTIHHFLPTVPPVLQSMTIPNYLLSAFSQSTSGLLMSFSGSSNFTSLKSAIFIAAASGIATSTPSASPQYTTTFPLPFYQVSTYNPNATPTNGAEFFASQMRNDQEADKKRRSAAPATEAPESEPVSLFTITTKPFGPTAVTTTIITTPIPTPEIPYSSPEVSPPITMNSSPSSSSTPLSNQSLTSSLQTNSTPTSLASPAQFSLALYGYDFDSILNAAWYQELVAPQWQDFLSAEAQALQDAVGWLVNASLAANSSSDNSAADSGTEVGKSKKLFYIWAALVLTVATATGAVGLIDG